MLLRRGGLSPRLAVLTSGGDAPGMNAAIRAVVRAAHACGTAVVGVERGYRGLLDGAFVALPPGDVDGIAREGGTVLGSARCLPFYERAARDQARAVLRDHGIGALVVIGGNGSLSGALALSDPEEAGAEAVQLAGIPATIDNDIALTRMSIGVDTALNTIVDACDNIADTATAHSRAFIVEVMGRDCGFLARAAAVATGADAVLLPEAGHNEDELVAVLAGAVRDARGRSPRARRVLCIKAEGVRVSSERLKQRVDAVLADDEIETRVTVLGHVVRGGRPSAFDRLLASGLGETAVAALAAGATRVMAAWRPAYEAVDLHDALHQPHAREPGHGDARDSAGVPISARLPLQ